MLSREEIDEIADRYRVIAFESYVQNRDFILRDNWPDKNAKTKDLFGLAVPEKPTPLPANSLGQRWWRFVIGSGALRNAGFVLIARIGAVDAKEIRSHIDRIQSILKDSGPDAKGSERAK